MGEERVDGEDAWVIHGKPNPGYHPKDSTARALFPKVDCRFWVVKSDYHWARVELETLDTVSVGLFLVRLAKGSRITLESVHVNGEVWLPRRITVNANARLLLVKGMGIDARYDYSDYKKFQAESRIVSRRRPLTRQGN